MLAFPICRDYNLIMETIISYQVKEYVGYNHWVEIEDVESGKQWFVYIVPYLTEDIFKNKSVLNGNESKIYAFSNEGKVWAHTPLGGAILGRMKGDIFGFYESGKLIKCKVIKLLS